MAVDISIVVPICNEEDSVIPLCKGIIRAVEPLGYQFEVLLVDDGSLDDSVERALLVAGSDSRFSIIKLSRNFGQTAALDAGFEQARGSIIVTMDGDLQNDPVDIELLVRKMNEGNDMVVGWRGVRQDRLVSRKLPSTIANWLIRLLSGIPIHDIGCGLRAYRSEIVKKLPLYSEMHRLLPMIVAMAGARIAEVKVQHHPRKFGASKYGISRIYKVIMDFVTFRIIFSLFRLPLFGFGFFAIPFFIISIIGLVAGAVEYVIHPDATLVIYIGVGLLCGSLGVFLLMVGILCDLIYRTGHMKIESLLIVEVIE